MRDRHLREADRPIGEDAATLRRADVAVLEVLESLLDRHARDRQETAAELAKSDDDVAAWPLGRELPAFRRTPWLRSERAQIVVPAKLGHALDFERHALAGEWIGAIGDVQMEMRSGRIAAEAERADDVAFSYTFADTHAHAARAQVLVERIAFGRDLQRNVIAGTLAERVCLVGLDRGAFGHAVANAGDGRVRTCEDLRAITIASAGRSRSPCVSAPFASIPTQSTAKRPGSLALPSMAYVTRR